MWLGGFIFQAENGIREAEGSSGIGDGYKGQGQGPTVDQLSALTHLLSQQCCYVDLSIWGCFLYTSDVADDRLCLDPGGRRII